MNIKLMAAVLPIAVAMGCGEGVTTEQKLAHIEYERAQVHADLLRQNAECQAKAIEFNGNERIVESCLKGLEAMTEISDKIIANLDRRIEAIERESMPKRLLTDEEVFKQGH